MIGEKNILFCTEAGSHIGGGHLARCLTLAQALKNRGACISFYCNEEAWEFKNLQNSKFAPCDAKDLKANYFDLIIIDHYGMNAEHDHGFRPYTKKIMVIDDLANRTHDCDMLLDFSPSRNCSDYKSLIPEQCKIFTGIEYIILRPDFFKLATKPRQTNTTKNIFLTMGSIDGKLMLPRVLEMIEKSNETYEIHVMVTGKTKTLSNVETQKKNSKHNIQIHKNLKNPAHLMHSCDFAITAGGMTCLELVSLGVPTLAMIVAENQIENVTTLDHKNFVKRIKGPNEILPSITKLQNGKLEFDYINIGTDMKIIPEIEQLLK